MNLPIASVIVSFVAPMLVLMLASGVIARKLSLNPRGIGWFVGLGFVSLGLLMIPVGNLPLARAFAGIADHWSVPMLALLVAAVVKMFLGVEVLRAKDLLAMWIFGIIAGVMLYPMALGLGTIDPFSLGWHFGPLFVSVGIIALWLQWVGNRFGIVLAMSIAGWWVGVAESCNFWDCLVDPAFVVVSMVCGVILSRKKSRKTP